jgi:hypothetical protein
VKYRNARIFVISSLLSGQAQLPWLQERFQNVDFSEGKPGEFPPGWHLGPERTPNFAAETAAASGCLAGKQCATVRSIGIAETAFCFLHQIYKADDFRGQHIKLRAAVRVSGEGFARLLLRIHRLDDSTSFRDDMGDHPIRAGKWDFYEISAPIPLDARDIELGVQDFGHATAFIDEVSVTYSK